jgi:nitric oxide synthase oxygenase domain/subunit
MIRPLETKVGENHPIAEIKAEATAFLQEMQQEGHLSTSEYETRLKEALSEIKRGAAEAKVYVDGQEVRELVKGVTSSGYVQTTKEVEWGLKVAWRNARKCIMRARFEELKLVDLRHIKTSKGMVDAIIEHTPSAYNNGRIQPSGRFSPSFLVRVADI